MGDWEGWNVTVLDSALWQYGYSHLGLIETVSQEGSFCDNVQVHSGAGDMQLIYLRN